MFDEEHYLHYLLSKADLRLLMVCMITNDPPLCFRSDADTVDDRGV